MACKGAKHAKALAEATDGSGKKDDITVTVTTPVSVVGVSVCPTS